MSLNLQDTFRLPLRAKTFGFVRLADGAVTLLAVETIVRMAFRAMRFLRVDVAGRCGIALGVGRRGQRVEVLRVHAGPIAAGVIHDMAIGDGPIREPQRQPVSFTVGAAESDDAVPVSVFVSRPQPASMRRNRVFGAETLKFGLGGDVHRRSSMGMTANKVMSVAA